MYVVLLLVVCARSSVVGTIGDAKIFSENAPAAVAGVSNHVLSSHAQCNAHLKTLLIRRPPVVASTANAASVEAAMPHTRVATTGLLCTVAPSNSSDPGSHADGAHGHMHHGQQPA